jgi:two-component sensor histidine kinase
MNDRPVEASPALAEPSARFPIAEDSGTVSGLTHVFPGDGEMAGRMRALDWAQSPVGPPDRWPQNLLTAIGICLASRFPMQIWWGPQLTFFYNDACIPFLGPGKHPRVLGRPARETWAEIWDRIGPACEHVLGNGRADAAPDVLLHCGRDLPQEEARVAFSFSPVFGEGSRVGGVCCTCTGTAEKFDGERRLDGRGEDFEEQVRARTRDLESANESLRREANERRRAEEALRVNERRMRGQKDAFQAAIDGAPPRVSLGILARIVTEEMEGAARTAFYVADQDVACLRALPGAGDMPESYVWKVDRFPIGFDSLACGLATAAGRPVLTRDVFEEPLWKPWVHLAKQYDFRGCWSFPIETRDRRPIGTFALYFREPRLPVPHDVTLAAIVTQAAAIILSRHRLEEEVAARTEDLRLSVAERDALLNEVHHRVKNNLQVIGSLLEMQANRVDDPQAYSQFEEACNRVLSIAAIHEVLYRRGSFSDIPLGEYVRDMGNRLIALYGLGGRVEVDVQDGGISLDLDRATSLGLVLNELISNSCKHAFPDARQGQIAIRFARGEGRIRVEVADNGVGFVAQPRLDSCLGLRLVRTIVTQNLGGAVDWGSEHGTWVAMDIAERMPQQAGRFKPAASLSSGA